MNVKAVKLIAFELIGMLVAFSIIPPQPKNLVRFLELVSQYDGEI
jgi:hypothetical protein